MIKQDKYITSEQLRHAAQVLSEQGKVVSKAEAEQAMADYATATTEMTSLQSKKKLDLLKIEDKYKDKLKEAEGKAEAAHAVVKQYALDNRDELCPDGKKSFTLGVGTVSFRLGAEKFKMLKDWTEDKILDAIKNSRKLKGFLKVKESVDKTALMKAHKKNADLLASVGFKVDRDEKFKVEV